VSNVNIRRAVENIGSTTSVYTPIVETVVNAIQAIESARRKAGTVTIRILRAQQLEMEVDTRPDIVGFKIEDNGIGFNKQHRDSFDTLYSDLKIKEGGKGFGRFICLKYFDDLRVDSTFKDGGVYRQRRFLMGKENEFIVNEKVTAAAANKTGSTVWLDGFRRKGNYEKKLTTLARELVERLLPYFITEDYKCPDIVLCEEDGSDPIRLNAYFTNELTDVIQEVSVPNGTFTLKAVNGETDFHVRIFKFMSPRNHRSKISLVAHKREVTSTPIHEYVPEFEDEFCEKDSRGNDRADRNYILKAYVFGQYLDDNVSLERGEFKFRKDSDLLLGVSQSQVESRAAQIAREVMGSEITTRQDRKRERVISYVDQEAPWHKSILAKIDLSNLPYNAGPEEIESRLQRVKFVEEARIKRDVNEVLSSADIGNLTESVVRVVGEIAENSRNDLVHYVALRRTVLQLLERSLEIRADGKYQSEGVVHDIIFPRKRDTNVATFEEHNLWVIDERLNFTEFVSSDVPLGNGNPDRPDLLVYNKRVSFRGDNEPSNPIIIFEFKKPERGDFANPSSDDDPVAQIVRYVNAIQDGKYKTPTGREIRVTSNTPFYGYVVCDLPSKVKEWLEREKNFTPMPDGLGWFHWYQNTRLYIEVWSWDKVLRDANMRNAIFFKTLGI
jgi:histidine kinase/DNA gyrase B/HSP90-like ATPase